MKTCSHCKQDLPTPADEYGHVNQPYCYSCWLSGEIDCPHCSTDKPVRKCDGCPNHYRIPCIICGNEGTVTAETAYLAASPGSQATGRIPTSPRLVEFGRQRLDQVSYLV